ncbi:hypothetical protein JKF63_02319 [Porcisia hertigi]|uniref:Uncharacterized protein n=1 Tax=Porcisia hertigi TaxID=2761500 RepID=A0A836HPC5_9TRYP|nr:hypothetical protein JKF63_02319 [Porcisia hertigi]
MASASASQPPFPSRQWGSNLLLRKVPLYAQARQYAAVDPDDPKSEGNTLSYGPSSYPLLAAVRSCYDMVTPDEATAEASSNVGVNTAVVDRSPFSGIDRAGYAHVPAQRKWTATISLTEDSASSNSGQSAAVVRRAAAYAVLDDALGPAARAQVLEPWFGVIEDRLHADAQQQQVAQHVRSEEKNGNEKEEKKTARKSYSDLVKVREGGDTPENSTGRNIEADTVRILRRKRIHSLEEMHGAVYTRLESAILHYSVATREEKEMLGSTRVASSDPSAELPLLSEGDTAAPPSPQTWGGRMLELVTSTVASEVRGGNDEEAEQQQKVLAYLKRVRWIATQWNSTTNQMAFKDAGASAPTWGQMTEAQRVKTEMLHTQGQRRRFRRPRRGGDGRANGDGDDAGGGADDSG